MLKPLLCGCLALSDVLLANLHATSSFPFDSDTLVAFNILVPLILTLTLTSWIFLIELDLERRALNWGQPFLHREKS